MKSAQIEAFDLQGEFETERQDYLESIRKLERQLQLQNQIIDRMQPCMRRDCNYYNIDKVRAQSNFDEENHMWKIPDLIVERSTLPGSTLPGASSKTSNLENKLKSPISYDLEDRDSDARLYARLANSSNSELSKSYFQPKRAAKLLNGPSPFPSGEANEFGQIRLDKPEFGQIRLDKPAASMAPTSNELVRRPLKLEALPLDTKEKKKKKKHKSRDT